MGTGLLTDEDVFGGPKLLSDAEIFGAAPKEAPMSAARETSAGGAYVAGMGKQADRMLEGLKQSGLGIAGIFSELLPERLRRAAQDALAEKLMAQEKTQADNAKRYGALEKEHPLATGAGEATTLLAAPVARIAEAPGALATAANMAASSAIPAAIEYGTPQERATRAGLAGASGAAGSAVLSLAGKAVAPIASRLTPEQSRIAADAAAITPLTAGQQTGNKAMQAIESAMEWLPSTSGAQSAIRTQQREDLTRELMRRLGSESGEATPEAVGAAKSATSGEFERIFGNMQVPIGEPQVIGSLRTIRQDSEKFLPSDSAKVVSNWIDELIGKVDENGDVPGRAYQAWRSRVAKQASSTNDGNLRNALSDLYKTVDRVAYDVASQTGEAGNLAAARSKWRDIRTIEPLVANETSGLIPQGKTLLRAANSNGTDSLKQLGRAAAFIGDQVPNSGTAQRQFAQSLLTGGLGGVGGYLGSGDFGDAARAFGYGAAGGFMLPKLAQSAINSGVGQKYLSGGFAREMSPIEQALMDRLARLGPLASGFALSGPAP